jgi:phosphate transport system permease protein
VRQYPLFNRLARLHSRFMFALCVAFTLLILLILVAVTGYLLSIGISSLHWSFFTRLPIPAGRPGAPGGMANALVGTAILIFLASAVGIPLGVLAGIYLSEYSSNSRLGTPTRFIADVLTGVPSIVVGILGYELLVAPLGSYNGYAGAAALAFIMIPIVARTTEEMLRLVPNSYREASIALGATKARTILGVVLPAATGSVVTGIMLAIARVAGETAPLLFTAMGARFMPLVCNASFPYLHPKLDDPFPSLTVQIFNYSTGPFPDQKRLAWAGILVLIALIFGLNLAVRFFTRSIQTSQH